MVVREQLARARRARRGENLRRDHMRAPFQIPDSRLDSSQAPISRANATLSTVSPHQVTMRAISRHFKDAGPVRVVRARAVQTRAAPCRDAEG